MLDFQNTELPSMSLWLIRLNGHDFIHIILQPFSRNARDILTSFKNIDIINYHTISLNSGHKRHYENGSLIYEAPVAGCYRLTMWLS